MAQFIMKSYQLQKGDILTESGMFVPAEGGRESREVRVTAVEAGEIAYGDMIAPVHYVTGTDLFNNKTVKWCKSPWHRWYATRGESLLVGTGV